MIDMRKSKAGRILAANDFREITYRGVRNHKMAIGYAKNFDHPDRRELGLLPGELEIEPISFGSGRKYLISFVFPCVRSALVKGREVIDTVNGLLTDAGLEPLKNIDDGKNDN